MTPKIRMPLVIAKRRITESLVNPGYYIATSVGLLMGYFLVAEFVTSVDSSGFDFAARPLYDTVVRILHGAFGATVLDKLFAEGPYLLASFFSFAPVLIFIVLGTIARLSFEKKVGAVELLVYGPVTVSDILLGFFLKDIFFSLLSLFLALIYLFLSALIGNLLLGPVALYSLLLTLFLAASASAYGILASALTRNTASAIALFTGTILLYLALTLGNFTTVGSYARDLAATLSWVLQWISPFYYLDIGMRALHADAILNYGIAILGLCVLTGLLLAGARLAMKAGGVRR